MEAAQYVYPNPHRYKGVTYKTLCPTVFKSFFNYSHEILLRHQQYKIRGEAKSVNE